MCSSVDQFADIYGKKLGMNVDGLRKTLWGDFYLNTKTKRIMKGAQVYHIPVGYNCCEYYTDVHVLVMC